VLCPINEFTKTLEFFEDGVGGGGPGERALVSVVMDDVAVDFVDQVAHAFERAAANRLLGDERTSARLD
jgi:hypothetical protein